MKIDNEYDINDVVYLKTDPDQLPRIVTGIIVRPSHLIYMLSSGATGETYHYDIELSTTKNVTLTVLN